MSVESRRALGSRYELLERLGTGAMGEVWRARDRNGGADVAAKLLRRELTSDPDILARFIQERSILVALDHPNIVRVHDLVVEGDDLAIVMDLVEGGSLGSLLRERGTLPARQAVRIAAAVLDALTYAHAHGALHRDVKPDNVLIASRDALDDGDVKLSDFSIARLAQESTVQATGLLGTPAYMPPELFVEGTFSGASDVYATGVLLYELLAGRTPFAGQGTAHTVGFRHIQMAPPELPVAPELWHVLATMLSKDPKRRLQAAATAQSLRALPDEALAGAPLPVQAEPSAWAPAADASTAIPSGAVHVREVRPDVDVGSTNLKQGAVEAVPLARDGSVETIAPRQMGSDVDAGTQLGVRPDRPSDPVLAPEIVLPDERRRTWVWVLAGLSAVALVVAAVVLIPKLPDRARSGSGAEINPVTFGNPQSLLESSVTGEIVDGEHARLVFNFRSKASEVDGDLLVMVPSASKEDPTCPSVPGDWVGGVGMAIDDVMAGGCGFQLRTTDPISTSGQTMSAELEVELQDDAALTAWLGQIKESTDRALAEEQPDESKYAIQRITDIAVEPEQSEFLPTTALVPVPYTVWPVYGKQQGKTENLFTSAGAESNVLRQLVGGLTETLGDQVVTYVTKAGCRNAEVQELRVTLRGPGDCTFNVKVGPFEGQATVYMQHSAG